MKLQPTHHRAQLSSSARMAVPWAVFEKGQKMLGRERMRGKTTSILYHTNFNSLEGGKGGRTEGRNWKRMKGRDLMCTLRIKIQQNFFPSLCLFRKPSINVLSIALLFTWSTKIPRKLINL